VSGPVLTLQSSNCARSVLSARPVKVISYVSGRTDYASQSVVDATASVPGGGICVVTRYWVIWAFEAIPQSPALDTAKCLP
jgi:hypothetical protein